MESTVDLLAEHPFLTGLTRYQLARLATVALRSVFHGGVRIFHEGDPADRFWLIISGRVDVDAERPGATVVVDTLGPGAVLGWSWLFPPYRWHLGTVAVETTLTVEFDGPRVRAMCDQDPALGHALSTRVAQVLAGRLQSTRRRLIDRHHGSPQAAADPG